MSLVPEQAKPTVAPPNKRAGYLLTGLGLFTGVVSALGLTSDELPDVWRNQPKLSYAAVTLVLIGVALGAIAGWVLDDETSASGKRRERNVLIWGNAALGAGLILIAWSIVANASDSSEPTVTAVAQQKKGNTILKAVIESSKLSSGQSLSVRVEPLSEENDPGAEQGYRVGRPIYSAIFGPDSHGSVKRSIRVAIPPGSFQDVGMRASDGPSSSCYEQGSMTGCVVVHLPPRSAPPELALKWRRRRLHVHLTAFDVPRGVVQFLARSVAPAHLLARSNIAANLSDDVNRSFVLPVSGAKKICVIVSENTKQLHCPPSRRSRPGWAMLRAPASH